MSSFVHQSLSRLPYARPFARHPRLLCRQFLTLETWTRSATNSIQFANIAMHLGIANAGCCRRPCLVLHFSCSLPPVLSCSVHCRMRGTLVVVLPLHVMSCRGSKNPRRISNLPRVSRARVPLTARQITEHRISWNSCVISRRIRSSA